MISVIENKIAGVYEIRFQYDPDLVELVKNVAGRRWIPEYKMWTIPRDRLGFLMNQLKGTTYEQYLVVQSSEDINVNRKLGTTNYIPDTDISDVDQYVAEGYKLFDHQVDFMKYAIYRQRNGYNSGFILADPPGTGKTLEVMNLAMYNRKVKKSKHCLIICCVNSAKYNWREDILKHTNGKEEPYILGSRLKRDKISVRHDTGGKEKLYDLQTGHMYGKDRYPELPYFLIVNIEAFRYRVGKQYPFMQEILNWINEGKIDLIAIDEIHRNCSPSSISGQKILQIKKKAKRQIEWIPMTGTPIVNKPTDVFLPLRLVDGHDNNSFYLWCQQFCLYGGFGDKEIIGYKNINILKQMLEPNMLRRRKEDILDLPPKIRYTEYIENTAYQSRLYDSIAEDLANQKESIVHSLNPLSQFLKLRQVNGSPELVDESLVVDKSYVSKNAKLSRLLQLIDDIVANGEKVVVFSNWVEPLRTLYKFVSNRYKTCVYTGTMKQDVRELHKQTFIHNPEYSVMLGTVGALGTSHTLTVARNIIFYDKPWNPSDVTQCEDRCHRPGTTQSVNIYSLICKDTVDERVDNILSTKEGISDYIVDGELDIRNHPEVFDLLIGHDSKRL